MNSRKTEHWRQIRLERKRRQKRSKRKILRKKKYLSRHGSDFFNRKKNDREYEIRKKNEKYLYLKAPSTFSFLIKPQETTAYFAELQKCSNDGQPIFVDLQQVQILTIDALMHILAWMDFRRTRNLKGLVGGNLPEDPATSKVFKDSGFLDHVKVSDVRGIGQLDYDKDYFRIVSGSKHKPAIVQQIIDFTINKLRLNGLGETKKLFHIISEMMGNVVEHAYNRQRSKKNKWYLMAHYDKIFDKVDFVFLDNGETIPQTIAKRGIEGLENLASSSFGIRKTLDCRLIESALTEQSNRSKSQQLNRGKGLPAIQKCSDQKFMNDLILVSRYAFVDLANNRSEVLNSSFKGTLYSWSFHRGKK